VMFKYELFNKENAPCHPVRVALIPDSMDAEIVVVTPQGDVMMNSWKKILILYLLK